MAPSGNPIPTVRASGLYPESPFLQTVTTSGKRVSDTGSSEHLNLDGSSSTTPRTWSSATHRCASAPWVTGGARWRGWTTSSLPGSDRQSPERPFLEIIRDKRAMIMEPVTSEARGPAWPFGIRVIDAPIKRPDLPTGLQATGFARMQTHRWRIAMRYRTEGAEKGREIRANADRAREIISARAYQESHGRRGADDAEAVPVTGRRSRSDVLRVPPPARDVREGAIAREHERAATGLGSTAVPQLLARVPVAALPGAGLGGPPGPDAGSRAWQRLQRGDPLLDRRVRHEQPGEP